MIALLIVVAVFGVGMGMGIVLGLFLADFYVLGNSEEK